MNVQVNAAAVQFARELVETGKYRINSVWKDNKPSAAAVEAFAAAQGAETTARWHLAIDLDAPPEAPERLLYPIGDFVNIHDTALRAAKSRGEADGQPALAAAAEDILDLFYRLTAC